MKDYYVSIKEENVLKYVYCLTANMAAQRGDALYVATESNIDLLQLFIEDGLNVLESAFGRYSIPRTKGQVCYSMPENWPDMRSEIDALANTFINNYTMAKWFELAGTGEKFSPAADNALQGIVLMLNERSKPI